MRISKKSVNFIRQQNGVIELAIVCVLLVVGFYIGVTIFYPNLINRITSSSYKYKELYDQFYEKNGLMYFRVKSSLFPTGYQILSGATSSEFQLLRCRAVNHCFSYSGNNIFFNSRLIESLEEKIIKNTEVYVTSDGNKLEYYLTTDKYVYFLDVYTTLSNPQVNTISAIKLDGVEPGKVIQITGIGYVKIGEKIFYSGQATEIDVNSFIQKGNTVIDQNSVYYNGQRVEYVDRESFTFIESDYYFKDKQNVYSYNLEIVEQADPASFTLITKWMATDGNGREYKRSTLLSPFIQQ